MGQVSTTFGVQVSARELYLKPTVAALAQALPQVKPPQVAAATGEGHQGSAELQHISRRPLTELFFLGELAPVDAAALLYFPDHLFDQASLPRDVITQDWCHDRPVLSSILESPLGRIGQILLPLFASDLHSDRGRLQRVTQQALDLAGRLGASTVSLTGLLPAVTEQGRLLAAAMPASHALPAVTCGYSTTAAAMALTVECLLAEGQRQCDHERLALVGLGPLATASLELLLQVLPHPQEIVLFDMFNSSAVLETLPGKLAEAYGFKGRLHVLPTGTAVPTHVYDASLIMATTPVSGLLDVALLQPGTLVVQASGLDCLRSEPALQRFRDRHDILCTEGDLLHAPAAFTATHYLPRAVEEALPAAQLHALLAHQPFTITGCVLAGLLEARSTRLRSAAQAGASSTALESYHTLKTLGFKAASLHWGDTVLAVEDIARFREQYGTQRATAMPQVEV